jgi:protein TIF31
VLAQMHVTVLTTCIFSLSQLNKAGQQLKILPHKVYNDKKEVVELCSSVECKGIIGNDGRHYILDLLRTFPPDVNFLMCKFMVQNCRAIIKW